MNSSKVPSGWSLTGRGEGDGVGVGVPWSLKSIASSWAFPNATFMDMTSTDISWSCKKYINSSVIKRALLAFSLDFYELISKSGEK